MFITQEQLKAALQKWEEHSRAGQCEPPEVAAARSPEEVAELAAPALWAWLESCAVQPA